MKRMKFLQHLCIENFPSMRQGDNYPTEKLNTAQKLACDKWVISKSKDLTDPENPMISSESL